MNNFCEVAQILAFLAPTGAQGEAMSCVRRSPPPYVCRSPPPNVTILNFSAPPPGGGAEKIQKCHTWRW